MEILILALGTVAAVVLLPLVIWIPAALYSGWLGAKIWTLLIVPTTGWPKVSVLTLVGLSLLFSCLRPTMRDTDKERETSTLIAEYIGYGFVTPTVVYFVAVIIAKVAL